VNGFFVCVQNHVDHASQAHFQRIVGQEADVVWKPSVDKSLEFDGQRGQLKHTYLRPLAALWTPSEHLNDLRHSKLAALLVQCHVELGRWQTELGDWQFMGNWKMTLETQQGQIDLHVLELHCTAFVATLHKMDISRRLMHPTVQKVRVPFTVCLLSD
jgi:hypothetical protein